MILEFRKLKKTNAPIVSQKRHEIAPELLCNVNMKSHAIYPMAGNHGQAIEWCQFDDMIGKLCHT